MAPERVCPVRRGIQVYDIGQDLTGWAQIKVDAPAGTPIEIFYSEKLGENGLLSNDVGFTLVGGHLQTDYYIAGSNGVDHWAPRFSYKGFRYVQISAPGAQPLAEGTNVELAAVRHLRTGFDATGRFITSAPLLEKIHENTRWAVSSNVMGVTTDTPIYEKNGWTGDAQLSAGVIALLFDAERLYRKQGQDMIDNQLPSGEVPLLAPSNDHYGYVGKPAFKPVDCCGATPAWDAFWFIIPWEAWMRYGDKRFLEQSYQGMKLYLDAWIPEWVDKDGDELEFTVTAGLGDWVPPEGTPTNIALASTAYYAHMTMIAANVADTLGKSEDHARYVRLFEAIREHFNQRFLTDEGYYRDEDGDGFTQTAQVLPLAFGLVAEKNRAGLARKLADDVIARGYNPWVGVLGARYLLPVLTEYGYGEVALEVAQQTDYPSWGYWIEGLGWTSLGEFWEATSRSRSHHFLGTIVHWFYEDLAGIKPLEPGYARVGYRPMINSGLDSLQASYESVRGPVASGWETTSEGLELSITVPPTATGELHLPSLDLAKLSEIATGQPLPMDRTPGISILDTSDSDLVLELESGHYRFLIQN